MVEIKNDFGDVVLYKNNTLEGKLFRFITKDIFTHYALRTSETTARALTGRGVLLYSLRQPSPNHVIYVILSHKDITEEKRKEIERLDEFLPNKYSTKIILKLGLGHIFGSNRTKPINYQGYTCSSRIAHLYQLAGLDIGNIHYSQYEPADFLNENFEIEKVWKRNKDFSINNRIYKLKCKK